METLVKSRQDVINVADEHGRQWCLTLLEWMVNSNVELPDLSDVIDKSGRNFRYKGEWITADELFQNFL